MEGRYLHIIDISPNFLSLSSFFFFFFFCCMAKGQREGKFFGVEDGQTVRVELRTPVNLLPAIPAGCAASLLTPAPANIIAIDDGCLLDVG